MKYFLISYHFTNGAEEDWHKSIKEFITHIEQDPELKGRISYRVLKSAKSNEYFHLASPIDEDAVKILETREYFRNYKGKTKEISGGTVTSTPLEMIAETNS